MKKTPNKKRRIVLAVVGIVLLVGTGLYIYQDQQHQQRVADDKQRYESALTDMNKFFDALGNNVQDRKFSKSCSYDKGPWSDVNINSPLCHVKIIAVTLGYIDISAHVGLMNWSNPVSKGEPGQGDGYYGGDSHGLSCSITAGQNELTGICYGRTDFQHYPRVDR